MLAGIGKFLLDWLYGKVKALAVAAIRIYQRRKEIDEQSEESVKPGERAKTDKEIEDALRDSIGGGF